MPVRLFSRLSCGLLALACAGACGSGDPAAPSAPPGDPATDPPSVYVAKVKNVLVGLAPTAGEIAAVEADPSALAGLVDRWMTLPEYRQKMLRFFALAFQQTQISIADFTDQAFPRAVAVNPATAPLLLANATESFARTALALVDEGRPFPETASTERFMMTPALMELYAFLDAWHIDDRGALADRVRVENPVMTITLESAAPIPIAQTLDPASPKYMHWYDPDVADPTIPSTNPLGCGPADAPYVFPPSAITLHAILHGSIDNRPAPNGVRCFQHVGSAKAPQLRADDFASWRMVTIRRPRKGEAPTAFYDLPTLRTTSELVLETPRVGFFSTPAFFANWKTNASNQMRVTTNQALIVATGRAVDADDPTSPSSTPGLDAVHADPKLGCRGCHRLLDPTRSILASAYTSSYHEQLDPQKQAQKGLFAFRGVVKPVADVADFGRTLGGHPLFAKAWAEKLSYWVNSRAFDDDDPELARIARAFEDSGFAFGVLVREVTTSPLTTQAAPTKTSRFTGSLVAVARRDHLCAAWNARLGLTDVCGLDPATATPIDPTIPAVVTGLPSDGYGRGAVAPVLPSAPTMFYRAGTENVCDSLAALVVDAKTSAPATAKRWSSAEPVPAIADFVHLVMGLAANDRHAAEMQALLGEHFRDALAEGATPTDALRSTFVVACTAPTATGMGL